MQPGMLPQPQSPQDQQQGFYKPAQPGTFDATAAQNEVVAQDQAGPVDTVVWDASEYVHHAKNPLWIVGLIAVAMVGLGVALWFTMWTFAVLVVVMAVTMGVFAFRPPRTVHYELSLTDIKIDEKLYNLNEFRAFGIMTEGAFYSIMLIPTKRFMPAISVYFAQEHGERIVDILGSQLPMEELHPDFLDTLMRRLRF